MSDQIIALKHRISLFRYFT